MVFKVSSSPDHSGILWLAAGRARSHRHNPAHSPNNPAHSQQNPAHFPRNPAPDRKPRPLAAKPRPRGVWPRPRGARPRRHRPLAAGRGGAGAQSAAAAAMAPSAQAGGGRGQAPGPGIRRGIRAVLLGPPGAGKGTQVRGSPGRRGARRFPGRLPGTAGGTGPSGPPHPRAQRLTSRLEGRGCPAPLPPPRVWGVRPTHGPEVPGLPSPGGSAIRTRRP